MDPPLLSQGPANQKCLVIFASTLSLLFEVRRPLDGPCKLTNFCDETANVEWKTTASNF